MNKIWKTISNLSPSGQKGLAFFLVIVCGYFTYFQGYDYPNHLFWDENYYLTAVAKYQKKIFFQESHPPLGKMLMAAAETILNPNPMTNEFEKDNYTKTIPDNYSFLGVRFFPAFFAWINCGLVFFLLLSLTGGTGWAVAMSSLYMFDNAIIVHSRGAMLDSIQLFGILMSLIAFFRIYKKSGKEYYFSKKWMAVLALGLGWATWTKLNGLVVGALLPLMLLLPVGHSFLHRIKKAFPCWLFGGVVFAVFSVCVWQTHFGLGQNIEPKSENEGYYKASPELKEILKHPETHPNVVENFYFQIRDYFYYMKQYAAGVPRLDLCKADENGSPFYWWPFGSRPINFRWENSDDTHVRYLYLVSNPFSWAIGLLAVILSFAFFLMKPLFPGVEIDPDDETQLRVLFIFYLSYMFSIAQIQRVMYLYHYIVPLVISFLIAAKWIPILVEKINIKFPDKTFYAQIIFVLFVAATWGFYYPLTYYTPLHCDEFNRRVLFQGWLMKPVNCKN